MILTYIIDVDETLKLTQGQGHKVKGHTMKLLLEGVEAF